MFNGNTQDVSVMVMGFETLPHNEYEAALEHLANVGMGIYVRQLVAKNHFFPEIMTDIHSKAASQV
jgi:hypothetical protein